MSLSVAVLGLGISGGVHAATYTFDGDTLTSGASAGGGTWDTNTTANWWDGAANVVWPTGVSGTNHTAIFGAGTDGTYAVNVVGGKSNIIGLIFNNSGYSLSAAAPTSIVRTPGGAVTLQVTVAAAKSATIGNNISLGVSNVLSIGGGGTLNIASGAKAFSGGSFQAIRIGGGAAATTVDVQTGGALYTQHANSSPIFVGGTSGSTLSITGGSVRMENTGDTTTSSSFIIGFRNTSDDFRNGTLTLDSGSVTIYRTAGGTSSGSVVFGSRSGGTDAITSVGNLNGGTVSVPNTPFSGALGTPGTGGGVILANGNTITSTVNMNGTNVTVGPSSTTGLRLLGGSGTITNSVSTFNLNSGTLTTPVITSQGGGSGTSATLNLNGGTIKANVSNANFLGATGASLSLVTAKVKAGGAVFDTNTFNIGVGQSLLHDLALGSTFDGGLTKNGTGTLTLSGANTYIGNTNITGGALTLATGGSLLLDVNDDAANTKLVGSGVLNLDGTLRLDVAGITVNTGSWTLVDALNLTEAYGGTFAVALSNGTPFTELNDIWSLTVDDDTYTFTEATGILTLNAVAVPEPASVATLGLAAVGLLARRRRD